ncbi:MAG: hypothetical protein ACQERF_06580, partial [Actinomycetota bacterium]
MNLATIPLLIAALFMLGSGGTPPGTVQLVLSGQSTLAGATASAEPHSGAVIVADADAHVPADAELEGPIHVIGGELTVDGHVAGDIVQLAGTVVVGEDATIAGELRHIAGTLEVDPAADVARRTTVTVTSDDGGGLATYLPLAVSTLLLALLGGWLARTRPRLLGNVADAVTSHPVIVLTVGVLLGLTGIALIVFMGFTLVLLPVALVAMAGGALALAAGTLGLGHAVGRRIPGVTPAAGNALGVIATVVALQVVGLIPVVGGLVAIAVLLAGLGATILTYFGLARFEGTKRANQAARRA